MKLEESKYYGFVPCRMVRKILVDTLKEGKKFRVETGDNHLPIVSDFEVVEDPADATKVDALLCAESISDIMKLLQEEEDRLPVYRIR